MTIRQQVRLPLLLGALIAGAGPALADAKANFHCEDGAVFIASFITEPGSVALAFSDGRNLDLPQAMSADGGRYAKGDDEFWVKGDSGRLTVGGKTTTCDVIE